mgnify:CR=1 FL=1
MKIETSKETHTMLTEKLVKGQAYRLVLGLLLDPDHCGISVDGVIRSVDVQGEYSVCYGFEKFSSGIPDTFGYLWDVPDWSSSIHMKIKSAEHLASAEEFLKSKGV